MPIRLVEKLVFARRGLRGLLRSLACYGRSHVSCTSGPAIVFGQVCMCCTITYKLKAFISLSIQDRSPTSGLVLPSGLYLTLPPGKGLVRLEL